MPSNYVELQDFLPMQSHQFLALTLQALIRLLAIPSTTLNNPNFLLLFFRLLYYLCIVFSDCFS